MSLYSVLVYPIFLAPQKSWYCRQQRRHVPDRSAVQRNIDVKARIGTLFRIRIKDCSPDMLQRAAIRAISACYKLGTFRQKEGIRNSHFDHWLSGGRVKLLWESDCQQDGPKGWHLMESWWCDIGQDEICHAELCRAYRDVNCVNKRPWGTVTSVDRIWYLTLTLICLFKGEFKRSSCGLRVLLM